MKTIILIFTLLISTISFGQSSNPLFFLFGDGFAGNLFAFGGAGLKEVTGMALKVTPPPFTLTQTGAEVQAILDGTFTTNVSIDGTSLIAIGLDGTSRLNIQDAGGGTYITRIGNIASVYIQIEEGGSQKIHIQGADVTINPGGIDADFIIRTDNDASAFVIDGGTDVTAINQLKVRTAILNTSHTLGTDSCYDMVLYVTGARTIMLPAVVEGMSITFITIGTNAVSIDVNGSDKIWLDGTGLDDGDKIINLSTAGDNVVFTYYSADGWYANTNGWTDGG